VFSTVHAIMDSYKGKNAKVRNYKICKMAMQKCMFMSWFRDRLEVGFWVRNRVRG